MNKKLMVDNFNKFKKVCLQNADDLLKAANASLEAGIDHASFHLSLLALEEVGKIEMEIIHIMSLIHQKSDPIKYNFDIDNHERKLFWAFWGPSFGREKQTKSLIDTDHNLAKNLHNNRLLYLYSDPDNPQHWSSLMKKGEAEQLYKLVETRLKIENSREDLTDEHIDNSDENLEWFLKIQEDDQKKKEIWGHKSQEKLLELKDVKKWILWLREIYDKNEKEMLEYAQKELGRKQPPLEKRLDPKWKISVEITTPSHSIRQKLLKQFNEGSNWIKLNSIDKDNHTFKIELTLSKNIPIQGLWEHGWGMTRMFVAALNITTNGFFWWNIKRDPSRYYTEIWDLENNAGVNIQINPRLEMNWKERRLVLREVDLTLTSIIFSYIIYCHTEKNEKHLDLYLAGLSLLAKNDIHLRLEINSFGEFFKALKTAMIENDDWDKKESFENAYQKATSWKFLDITDEMKKIFPLGFSVENEHKGFVDLTAVYAMKNYCEIYFQTLAVRYVEKKDGSQIRIVTEKNKDKENTNVEKEGLDIPLA